MSFIKVIILAVIQGLTEFLPVSSSGHLVLFKNLLKLDSPGAFLEVTLHLGTLLSILVFYRKRIRSLLMDIMKGQNNGRYYAGAVIIASVPAVVFALLLADRIESLFDSPRMALVMLCITGLVLLSICFRKKEESSLSYKKSIFIGLAQACALVPGISRSGMTITLGRHLGLSSERAIEFSLFMAIPALVGAALLETLKLGDSSMGDVTIVGLVAGIIVSAVVGYFAIVWLLKLLSAGKFWVFGVYCLVVGILGLLFMN